MLRSRSSPFQRLPSIAMLSATQGSMGCRGAAHPRHVPACLGLAGYRGRGRSGAVVMCVRGSTYGTNGLECRPRHLRLTVTRGEKTR
jgi:hypothetical protein